MASYVRRHDTRHEKEARMGRSARERGILPCVPSRDGLVVVFVMQEKGASYSRVCARVCARRRQLHPIYNSRVGMI